MLKRTPTNVGVSVAVRSNRGAMSNVLTTVQKPTSLQVPEKRFTVRVKSMWPHRNGHVRMLFTTTQHPSESATSQGGHPPWWRCLWCRELKRVTDPRQQTTVSSLAYPVRSPGPGSSDSAVCILHHSERPNFLNSEIENTLHEADIDRVLLGAGINVERAALARTRIERHSCLVTSLISHMD